MTSIVERLDAAIAIDPELAREADLDPAVRADLELLDVEQALAHGQHAALAELERRRARVVPE